MEDAFAKRERTLEERYFAQKDVELLDKLRQRQLDSITKEDIAKATGIQDDVLLDRIVHLKISVASLAALSIVPLVEVAWADGSIDPAERTAILKAATEAGVDKEGPGYKLLLTWLEHRPAPDALSVWKEYVAAFAERLDADGYRQVRDNLLTRARQVAEAAGGFFGMGAISPNEKRKLAELEAAFHK